jgi:hypothetical protein
MMTSWFARLDRAKSISETLSVARDFLAEWTPSDLAMLPQSCRPGRMRDEQDVEAFHACLVEAYRESRATGAELDALQRLTSFMVRVAMRLSELAVDSGSSGGSSGPAGGPGLSAAPPES